MRHSRRLFIYTLCSSFQNIIVWLNHRQPTFSKGERRLKLYVFCCFKFTMLINNKNNNSKLKQYQIWVLQLGQKLCQEYLRKHGILYELLEVCFFLNYILKETFVRDIKLNTLRIYYLGDEAEKTDNQEKWNSEMMDFIPKE